MQANLKPITDRLDKMESDIKSEFKNLNEALIAIARMEERFMSLFDKHNRQEKLQNELTARLAELEKQQAAHNTKLNLMWAGLGAAVMAFISVISQTLKKIFA